MAHIIFGKVSGSGQVLCTNAASVAAKLSGFSPQAKRVHIGAPEPPVNLDHYSRSISTRMPLERGATHNILVWIQKYIETILPCYPQDLNCMLNPFFVVLPRSGRLDCLPGKYIPNSIITKLFQPVEVDASIFYGERACMEINVISVKKLVGNVRGQIWRTGILRVPGEVDSSECYLSAMRITELAIFNSKPQGHVVYTRFPDSARFRQF